MILYVLVMRVYRKSCVARYGFTLLEILVAATVISLLSGVSLVGYNRFQERQQLNFAKEQLRSDLRQAQQKALSGEKPAGWCVGAGVSLQSWRLEFINGNSYRLVGVCSDKSTVVDKTASLAAGATLSAGADQVEFQSITGAASDTSFTLRLGTAGGIWESNIDVTTAGLVQSSAILATTSTPAPVFSPTPTPFSAPQAFDVLITTEILPAGAINHQYEARIIFLDNTGLNNAMYSATLVDGALPPGLALLGHSFTAPCFAAPCPIYFKISGIPTQLGSYNFTVQVKVESRDSKAAEIATRQFTINTFEGKGQENPLIILDDPVPPAYIKRPYVALLRASGGDGERYIWSVIGGVFPPGLEIINQTQCLIPPCPQAIDGTPTQVGVYTFRLSVQSGMQTTGKDYSITVYRPY